MKFEIINPSDKAYIEGEDFMAVCVANALLGDGKYALKQIDGDLEMPLMLFGANSGFWEKQFGKTDEECFKSLDPKKIADALASVHLAREQSSLNDIVGRAKDIEKVLRKRAAAK